MKFFEVTFLKTKILLFALSVCPHYKTIFLLCGAMLYLKVKLIFSAPFLLHFPVAVMLLVGAAPTLAVDF